MKQEKLLIKKFINKYPCVLNAIEEIKSRKLNLLKYQNKNCCYATCNSAMK